MTPRGRRLREQAQRRRLILTTARGMAGSEGWDYVTRRRLADRIGYSRPVLCRHVKNKDAIVHAVAFEGFAGLAAALRTAREEAGDPQEALALVARACLDFAGRGPVRYEAMLTLDPGGDTIAAGGTPAPLAEVLTGIGQAVEPVAVGCDGALLAVVLWSVWYGLGVLSGAGRRALDPGRQWSAVLTGVLPGPAAQPV
ncbi:TetR/AcrR family transcriptional regulator [Streptomyces sp. NBC_01483]|uniref:TetR/AcrR family transcriptional regulator n=1 Tax=Streptomyces sp. NBC_01483 TaxID=2903883 RepID=UPI002E334E34|nr:TetR family transcriptional regulator [Streptomyces sp. NBC_01483]